MSSIGDWLDLMPATVKIERLTGRDRAGGPSYGPPSTYRARVNFKSHFVRGANGELVSARGTAWLATVDPITVRDRITLSDGTTPPMLVVNQESDESAPLYTRIDLG